MSDKFDELMEKIRSSVTNQTVEHPWYHEHLAIILDRLRQIDGVDIDVVPDIIRVAGYRACAYQVRRMSSRSMKLIDARVFKKAASLMKALDGMKQVLDKSYPSGAPDVEKLQSHIDNCSKTIKESPLYGFFEREDVSKFWLGRRETKTYFKPEGGLGRPTKPWLDDARRELRKANVPKDFQEELLVAVGLLQNNLDDTINDPLDD